MMYFNNVSQSEGGVRLRSHALRRLFAGMLAMGLVMPLAVDRASAAPSIAPLPEDGVVVTLPDIGRDVQVDHYGSEAALAQQVQAWLRQARSLGDPRYLGYARSAFDSWPAGERGPQLMLLEASLLQSLHEFERAERLLQSVIADGSDSLLLRQAWLIRAQMALAQGRFTQAKSHCDQLQKVSGDLIADSCIATVFARTGRAMQAYERLKIAMFQKRYASDAVALAWSEGTLADIAGQLGLATAADHWRLALALDPSDLYARAAYADWLLQQEQWQETINLTTGYEQVDSLAVLRAIAEHRLNQPSELTSHLNERFEEAQWRGDLLHRRELARFQLDVMNQPASAFENAWRNWQDQREPADTRLALRAAMAADEQSAERQIRQWLSAHAAVDSRFPEAEQ